MTSKKCAIAILIVVFQFIFAVLLVSIWILIKNDFSEQLLKSLLFLPATILTWALTELFMKAFGGVMDLKARVPLLIAVVTSGITNAYYINNQFISQDDVKFRKIHQIVIYEMGPPFIVPLTLMFSESLSKQMEFGSYNQITNLWQQVTQKIELNPNEKTASDFFEFAFWYLYKQRFPEGWGIDDHTFVNPIGVGGSFSNGPIPKKFQTFSVLKLMTNDYLRNPMFRGYSQSDFTVKIPPVIKIEYSKETYRYVTFKTKVGFVRIGIGASGASPAFMNEGVANYIAKFGKRKYPFTDEKSLTARAFVVDIEQKVDKYTRFSKDSLEEEKWIKNLDSFIFNTMSWEKLMPIIEERAKTVPL